MSAYTNRLKQVYAIQNTTQEEVEQALGFEKGDLNDCHKEPFEDNKNLRKNLRKIADYFGITLSELLLGEILDLDQKINSAVKNAHLTEGKSLTNQEVDSMATFVEEMLVMKEFEERWLEYTIKEMTKKSSGNSPISILGEYLKFQLHKYDVSSHIYDEVLGKGPKYLESLDITSLSLCRMNEILELANLVELTPGELLNGVNTYSKNDFFEDESISKTDREFFERIESANFNIYELKIAQAELALFEQRWETILAE